MMVQELFLFQHVFFFIQLWSKYSVYFDHFFPSFFFFFNDTATTEIYTLSLHDALPISLTWSCRPMAQMAKRSSSRSMRSEEHTSELQSRGHLVCRLLLEKKKKKSI